MKSIKKVFFSIKHFFSDKRVRFTLSAFFLGMGLLYIQSLSFSRRYWFVAAFSFLSFLFSLISLYEGFSFGVKWFITPILPVFFSAAVALFYFLFPASLAYRIAILIFFSLGIYVTLLVENIFMVAALRTIALLRAAQTIGFLITLLTLFFLYNIVFSFRLFFWENAILVLIISFPLFLHSLWTVNLGKGIEKENLLLATILSLIVAEASLAVSFLPVNVLIGSLFLVCVAYVLLGLVSAHLAGRLFSRTIREYLIVGSLMLLSLLLATSWTG